MRSGGALSVQYSWYESQEPSLATSLLPQQLLATTYATASAHTIINYRFSSAVLSFTNLSSSTIKYKFCFLHRCVVVVVGHLFVLTSELTSSMLPSLLRLLLDGAWTHQTPAGCPTLFDDASNTLLQSLSVAAPSFFDNHANFLQPFTCGCRRLQCHRIIIIIHLVWRQYQLGCRRIMYTDFPSIVTLDVTVCG